MTIERSDVSLIKGMLLRGDRQSDIAAYFGGSLNSGRISEINTGKRGQGIPAASMDELPPPGPYQVSFRSALKARDTLIALRDLVNQTLAEIEAWESNQD